MIWDMRSPDGITYIGDRPAQICALVTSADLRYTGDKLNPFEVYEKVEQYVEDNSTGLNLIGSTPNATPAAAARWRQFMTTQRRIVLSTGLMWLVKYEGMAVKQLHKLLSASFVTPKIFVLPVPENVLVNREANAKLLSVCTRTQSFRDHVRFLGTRVSLAGDASWQAQPTPAEVLTIVDQVTNTPIETI